MKAGQAGFLLAVPLRPHVAVLANRPASVARHLGEEAFELQLQAPSDSNCVRSSKTGA